MSAPNSQKATIPSYQDIAQATFGTLWPEATPQDWALVVHKLREALQAQQAGPSSRDAVLEAAAEVCDRAASKWHSDYKIGNGPHRASSHREGMSDGADELATAIRALKTSAPSEAGADDARDTARLDWLEKTNGAFHHLGYGEYRHYFGPGHGKARDRIDKAMAEESVATSEGGKHG